MSKVSVILPCYNVEKYLPRAIESVLKQTFSDFELLVVIDGSPDNSIAVAEEYAKIDGRIKVFEKENGGLSDARNYGMARAKGEYIYFMDSDDWIEPNLLKDNIRILEDESLDFVIFGYIQDDEDGDGRVIDSKVISPGDNFFVKDLGNLYVDENLLGLLGYAWNKVYRRRFLTERGILFEKGTSLVEDILFNAQVYENAAVIKTTKQCYYHYLNRPVLTLMKKFYSDSFELKVKKNLALDKFLTEWGLPEKNQILAYSLFLGIKYALTNLYRSDNNLTDKERAKYLSEMWHHPRSREILQYLKPKNIKDRAIYFLLKYEWYQGIKLLKKI